MINRWLFTARWSALTGTIVVATILTACGGSSDSLRALAGTDKPVFSKVVVAGDSVADVGAYGYKFTVQKSGDPNGYPIYPQLVANALGIGSQCAFFRMNPPPQAPATQSGCTNFAVGGSHIVNPAAYGGPTSILAIPVQLAAAVQANGGRFGPSDLVIVEAGGNDAGSLLTAYLGAAAGPAGLAEYQNYLAMQLDASSINRTLVQSNGAATAAGLYMQAAADTYWNTVKSNVLDKGATHVVIFDMPNITLTPTIKGVLAQNAAASGGGVKGAAVASEVRAALQQWIQTFNARLVANTAGDSRVVIVPFYETLTAQVTNPATYQLTNATDAVCMTADLTCVNVQLDAVAGKTPGWWTTYLFSDGFHPSPYGHGLLATLTKNSLVRAGWL